MVRRMAGAPRWRRPRSIAASAIMRKGQAVKRLRQPVVGFRQIGRADFGSGKLGFPRVEQLAQRAFIGLALVRRCAPDRRTGRGRRNNA